MKRSLCFDQLIIIAVEFNYRFFAGSTKEALEGELELGSPEDRRCSSAREGG